MGLFRRGDRTKPEATQDFSDRRPHSHVALAPEDVADSERCRPDTDLSAYASARGLTFGGSVILGTFVGVLPTWAEYVFNSSRGELAPGRFGLVEHELLEIPVNQNDPSGSGISGLGGQFWAVKRGFPPNWKKRLIPGVIELGMDEPPNEPFAAYATWAPVTSVYVHVPEAACAPRISVGSADRHNALGNTSLDDVGLPQYRLLTDIPEDLRVAALGGAAGRALNSIDAPYVSMLLSFSQLRLMRNGFVRDEAELDGLIAQAVAIAEGLAAACNQNATTARFDTQLPPPEPQTGRLAGIDRWDETFAAAEKAFGMALEDPRAYHAAFPHLQAPGTARGVLRGTMPGGADGRLAFHEHGGRRSGFLRGVALFEAAPNAEPTPVGGVLHEPTQMYVAVGDGIVACWNRQMDPGTLAVTPTAERAQATLRDLGLR